MKKIYSFVLMAAMLLIGTNVNAENELSVGGNTYSTVQAAFNAAADGQTITLTGGMTDVAGATLEANKHIILDLGNNVLQFNLSANNDNAACITIKQGILEIKNGEIQNSKNNKRTQLIRVIGTTTAIDAATDPYSQVIVAADAKLTNTQSNDGLGSQNKFNALEITENATKVDGKSYSNGARIDVYGEVEAQTYGIKVNGTIKKPDNVNYSPYVYIHNGATVSASATAPSAAAAYSSGYARWIIEGECSGSTGLYAKSGDIDITGSITSTNTKNEPTTGKSSGIEAGGSAIVIESNKNYDGHIDVTVSAGATITATNGYAIEEKVDSEVDQTKVEAIKIEGGSMAGGAGAIIVDEKTTGTSTDPTHTVTVVGGQIDGTIQIDGQTTKTVSVEQFINGTTASNLEEGADYLVVKSTTNPADPSVTYTVTPNLSKVITLNADGYTTFSAAYVRSIKADDYSAGLKAYYAEYKEVGGEQSLVLHELDNDHVIPVGIGVVFKGAANQTYSLLATGSHTTGTDYATVNALSAATAWSANEAVNGIIAGEVHANAYVLSGNMMYKYEGANMKANKAYLDLGTNPAPKRIKMVFAETQDIENVEFEAVKAEKFIENGQVLIKRGEKVYNVQGQIVK